MARGYSGYTINRGNYLKYCSIHGMATHDNDTNKCLQCTPKTKRYEATDPEATARRRAIEDHQERRKELKQWTN